MGILGCAGLCRHYVGDEGKGQAGVFEDGEIGCKVEVVQWEFGYGDKYM